MGGGIGSPQPKNKPRNPVSSACECEVSRRGVQETCKKSNRSHTQTHDKNNTTNDHTKNHPPLNNDRRWRGNGAYHLPHPGGRAEVSVGGRVDRRGVMGRCEWEV